MLAYIIENSSGNYKEKTAERTHLQASKRMLTTGGKADIMKYRPGAAGIRLAPVSYNEYPLVWLAGRLLLFAVMYLQEQAANANDQNANLNQIGICHHWAAPLSEDQRARSCPLSRGPTAYRYWQR